MLADGFFFSLMVGIGETYLPAFMLAVSAPGIAEIAAGLITSVPLLAGAGLQLLSPRAVRWFGSHRRWVVLCATIQAASFLPLCAGALAGRIPTTAVFCIAALYWGFGMSTGPAWNTWAETIVPRRLRTSYFARRTKFTQAGVLVGFVAGGVALHVAKMYDSTAHPRYFELRAFALLFLIAGVCRFISARCLASQSEPQPLVDEHRNVTVGQLWKRALVGKNERLLIYLISVQFSVYIAAPYFNPFMLGHLQLPYATYMLLIASSFVAKMLSLAALGRVAERWGAQRLLWVGGIGIIPLSGMWIISRSFPFLVIIQLAGGVAWAAYELAMFLLFFETIRRDERTSILTVFNVANALAIVLGSLCGGAILRVIGEQPDTYLLIFGLSSVARLFTLVFLSRLPEFHFHAEPMGLRTLAVRPSDGSMDAPILPSLPEDKLDRSSTNDE